MIFIIIGLIIGLLLLSPLILINLPLFLLIGLIYLIVLRWVVIMITAKLIIGIPLLILVAIGLGIVLLFLKIPTITGQPGAEIYELMDEKHDL